MILKSGRKWLVFVISISFLTDMAIFLNIPFLRQIFGFLFLTILPGLLIIQILKLNRIGFLEKIILSWGLSISFLIFFGLLINTLLPNFGYRTPLSTISLVVSFNITFSLLTIIGYKVNKESIFTLPNLNLSTPEKAFLIVPIIFPALSVFGMHVMNTTDNNIILIFMLFLIPIYVAFVCFFNNKFPERLYPVVILLISISLLLLLSLRSNHIIGGDIHREYCFFQITLYNLHWSIFGPELLDACLSISLLPTIYQSILNTSPEFLFKILYSLIFSISPLAIYVLSKKYIKDSYAFLASFFFMSQCFFFYVAANPRTSVAILFFTLAMIVLFNDKIDALKKRILIIVFMASCIVSHYSTTYIFFFIMLGAFVGVEILSTKYTFKKIMSLTIVLLFFALIFFWYSQVTKISFNAGVRFIENTLINLNDMFIKESRSGSIQSMAGGEVREEVIAYKINFFFNWATIAFIGIGIITLIRKYKELSFPELKFKKPDFLKDKFEVEHFVIALFLVGILVIVVALPHLTVNYDMSRPYTVAMVILSTFFVIGGIMLSKHFFFLKKKTCAKRKSIDQTASQNLLSKSVEGGNCSEVWAYLTILLVLLPYFLCTAGITYAMFGEPRSVILSSEGEQYDLFYIHDQESNAVKWLSEYGGNKLFIYTDRPYGIDIVISQGKRSPYSIIGRSLFNSDYICLSHDCFQGKLIKNGRYTNSVEEISDTLYETNKIYDDDVVIYENRERASG